MLQVEENFYNLATVSKHPHTRNGECEVEDSWLGLQMFVWRAASRRRRRHHAEYIWSALPGSLGECQSSCQYGGGGNVWYHHYRILL